MVSDVYDTLKTLLNIFYRSIYITVDVSMEFAAYLSVSEFNVS